jgi:hypothetical protein
MNGLPPANLAALKGILGKSKALMEHVETDNYQKGNLDASMMVTSDQLVEGNQMGGQMPIPQRSAQSMNVGGYNDQMVDNSRLPDHIKNAMKEHKIPALNPANVMQSFSLEDMGDLVEKSMPSPQQYQQQRINEQQYQQQPVQQSMNVNEQMIRAIVKEELLNILGGEFTKQIRENAIKSTIQTLIKEGKVKTTTRKKQVRRD